MFRLYTFAIIGLQTAVCFTVHFTVRILSMRNIQNLRCDPVGKRRTQTTISLTLIDIEQIGVFTWPVNYYRRLPKMIPVNDTPAHCAADVKMIWGRSNFILSG